MTDQPARPAMTMREIRTALGHTDPPVLVEATRYEVSVLPDTHPDRWLWSATVIRTAAGHWTVHDSDSGYDATGQRVPIEDAHPHKAQEAALGVARRVAPHVTVNGHGIADAPTPT